MARLSSRSLVLLVVPSLWMACGGSLAPGGGNGQDGGGVGGGGVEAGGQDSAGPTDGPAVMDSPVFVDAPTGPCQVDGVPCLAAEQCCSNACTGSVCGNGTTPTCLGDGTACSSAAECCSDECNGTCVASTPPSCPVPVGASACEVCVAGSCCPQIIACEADSVCGEAQACFQVCDTMPGVGAKCALSCLQKYPSSAAQSLFQCAATSCQSTCG